MSDQPQTTAPEPWTPPAADTAGQVSTALPAPAPPSDADQIAALKAQVAALESDKASAAAQPAPSAPATPAAPVAPNFKVGQLVGYAEDYLGFDVARHGIVVAIEKSELADGSEKYFARVTPLPASLHLAADQLTVQD